MSVRSHKLINSWGLISGNSQNGAGATRSSRYMGINAAIWTILSIIFFLQINSYFHPALTSEIAWIIAGIAIGAIFSAVITQRLLSDLERTGQVVTTLKSILISLGAAVVLISLLLSVVFGDFSVGIQNGLLNALASAGPAFLISRFLLMKNWEKRNRKLIFQDRFRFYVSPKNPVNVITNQTILNQTSEKNEKVALN